MGDEICSIFKEVLGEKVEKVTVSSRLDSFPCVLVVSKFGWSANMERIMKAQAGTDTRAYEYMRGRRSLEINPKSPLLRNLFNVAKSKGKEEIHDSVELMYQTALLSSGFDLEDPLTFVRSVYRLMEERMDENGRPTYPEL